MCGKTNSRVKLYLLLGIKPDPGIKEENKNNVGWLKKAGIGHVLVNGTVRVLTQLPPPLERPQCFTLYTDVTDTGAVSVPIKQDGGRARTQT